MILEILLLIIGFIGLFIGLTTRRIMANKSCLSKRATYSKRVNPAFLESGIYIEHGMVNKRTSKAVQPERKLSDSFYEALH